MSLHVSRGHPRTLRRASVPDPTPLSGLNGTPPSDAEPRQACSPGRRDTCPYTARCLNAVGAGNLCRIALYATADHPQALGIRLVNSVHGPLTVAALITQGATVAPLAISDDLSSELGGGPPHAANALALAMVACVALVMAGYALLQRRAGRWLA